MAGQKFFSNISRRSFLSAASAAALAGIPGTGRGQSSAAGTFENLRDPVGIFLGRGGTIGWMVIPEAVVVVDSQFPQTAEECLRGVNQRSHGRTIDFLINTHHHGDHTAGNVVFRPKARRIVAHERVPELLRQAAARNPDRQTELPDTTFSRSWRVDLGSEAVSARYYGQAHTGGDITVHFEKADIVHMGDLVFNRRHPYIDRPSGALIAGWIEVLEKVAAEHSEDTLYIYGHAGERWKVTGRKADLLYQRDYFTALLEYTRREIRSGKSRDDVVNDTSLLKGFDDHGPLIARVMSAAYDELAESLY